LRLEEGIPSILRKIGNRRVVSIGNSEEVPCGERRRFIQAADAEQVVGCDYRIGRRVDKGRRRIATAGLIWCQADAQLIRSASNEWLHDVSPILLDIRRQAGWVETVGGDTLAIDFRERGDRLEVADSAFRVI
jgi:hypothetical protein